jgi:phage-related protein
MSMTSRLIAIPLMFWRSGSGREPVREWLKEMLIKDRRVVGRDLRRLQYGWPLGMPLVRPLPDGLWELRSSLPSRREARMLFVANEHMIVVLHGFIKKTQKTPPQEIKVAQRRLKEVAE